MKVALVHDSLGEFGGAERFLQGLLEVFPDADVYTAFVDRKILREFFPALRGSQLHVSWAQKTPLAYHSSLSQCLSPSIWRRFDFEKYNCVISSSAYLFSNLIRIKKPVHIQYIHSLPKNVVGLEPISPLQRALLYGPVLRYLYGRALRSTPYIITNSRHTQRVVKRIYGVGSIVIYPPVHIPNHAPKKLTPDYFFCISRIDKTKGLELPIIACSRLGLSLKVVGVTNDVAYEQYLRSLAGPTVEFLGFLSDRETQKLYAHASAFIFPSKNEDFGIAPVEAMAHGVPVIAYRGGGVRETVVPHKTGLFFDDYSVPSLIKVLKNFPPTLFHPDVIYRHAQSFDEKIFRRKIKQYIHRALNQA